VFAPANVCLVSTADDRCVIDSSQINQIYKYAFYRLCKTEDTAESEDELRERQRKVNISLRANRLEADVVFQMMTLFEQQQSSDGSSGCSLHTDLRENRIQYFLDPGAAIHLSRQGGGSDVIVVVCQLVADI
jgi:hypothetical protein